MTNYFEELSKIECVTEKRKSGGTELTYVSWADAWSDMKKKHPEARYTIYEDANGFPFWSSKYGIDVKVGVTVNGLEHIVRLPVMDGNNNAMKDEPYEYSTQHGNKRVEAADTFDINKAIQRCFAKACAMHGLGLYVYRGEDLPDGVEKVVTNIAPKPVEKPADPKPSAYSDAKAKWFNHTKFKSTEESDEWKQLAKDMAANKFPSAEEYIMDIKKRGFKIYGPVEDEIRTLFATLSVPF